MKPGEPQGPAGANHSVPKEHEVTSYLRKGKGRFFESYMLLSSRIHMSYFTRRYQKEALCGMYDFGGEAKTDKS